MKIKKFKKGFTLVELLVFITILSLFFVTAVTVAVSSLRNIKINEHRLLATRYAQELEEWLRSQKELDWNLFIANADSQGITYCFNTTPPPTPAVWTSGHCSTNGLNPAIFKRELVFKDLGGTQTQASADITVTWQDAGGSYSTQIVTQFAIWE